MANIRNIQLSTYIDGYIEAWESDANASNNTSVVHARVWLHRNNTWNGNTYSDSVYRKLTINGVTVYEVTGNVTVPPQSSGYVCIAEGLTTVTHNADGSKTVEVGFQSTDNYTSYFNCGWSTGTLGLTTIARKSSPSVSPGSINLPSSSTSTAITVNTNRASSTFTHTIKLSVNNTVIATKTNVGSSTTFSYADISNKILEKIPNATSATVGVSCETFNGSTSLGSNSASFNIVVTTTAAPTFGDFSYKDSNAKTVAVTGDAGILVQGLSIPEIGITAGNAAIAKYYASMKHYNINFDGTQTTVTYSTSAINQKLTAPKNSGNLILSLTAVDSRALSRTLTKYITVLPYSAPIINASIARTGGYESETTLKIAGTFTRSEKLPNTINNSSGVRYRYKKSSESTWGNWINRAVTLDLAKGTFSSTDLKLTLDNQSQWDIQIQAEDSLKSTTVTLVLPVGKPVFFIGKDGRIGVGKKPDISKSSGESGLLDCAGRVFSNGNPLMPTHIGQVIMSTTLDTAAKVAAVYGGTWQAWGAGRVPVGFASGDTDFGTINKTGGAKTVALTVAQMPSHTHSYSTPAHSWGEASQGGDAILRGSDVSNRFSRDSGSTGNGQAHNNLPPYRVVYMWERTN